jgi:WhiB family redox-sensing transcriptional regulator
MIIPKDQSEWMTDALCRKPSQQDLWFPEKHPDDPDMSMVTALARKAKEVCNLCPVKNRCLDWALANDEQWGIWGGVNMSPTRTWHRKKMRQERQIALIPKHARRGDVRLHCPGDLRRNRPRATA